MLSPEFTVKFISTNSERPHCGDPRPAGRRARGCVVTVLALTCRLFATEVPDLPTSKAHEDDVVQLGKVVVDERGLGRTYLHVEVPGFEILSPFSVKLTQIYARELLRQREMLGFFIPAALESSYDAPQPIFLDDQPPPAGNSNLLYGRTYALPQGVLTQSLAGIRGVPVKTWDRTSTSDRSTSAWSRATSADGIVFYSSLFGFDYTRQTEGTGIAAADRGLNHVFPLPAVFAHRRPRWPEWLEDALDGFGGRFYSAQTLQVFMLLRLTEPPVDLSVDRVFAPHHAGDTLEELRLRRQAAEVFLNWALVGDDDGTTAASNPRRDTFWQFAEQTALEPVTSESFARYFGPDAWNDLLRMWRKCVAWQSHASTPQTLVTYWPPAQPKIGEISVRPATRAEMVRIKSEYEWRIGREFADAVPEIAKQCYAQAGWRLHHAYEDGERDPRFLGVLACYECDVGSPAEARRFVEEAVSARVVRPRVYFEQAQFRFADERATLATPQSKLTLAQVRHVRDPLLIAQAQRPALVETYQLLAKAWTLCEVPPPLEDLNTLARGLRLFPRDAALAYNVARLHARSGDLHTAAEIATRALSLAPEESELHRYLTQLRDAASVHQPEPTKRLSTDGTDEHR